MQAIVPRGYPLIKSGVHHKIKSGHVRLDPIRSDLIRLSPIWSD